MKAIRLLTLSLASILLVGAAVTVRSHGSRTGTDVVEPPLVVADQSVRAQTDLSDALSLASAPAAAQAASTWQIETVDPTYDVEYMSDRILRLDDQCRPHIAYGGHGLYYARFDGTQWHTQTVDATPGVGRYTSMALDDDGHPHIAYQAADGGLEYAHWDPSGWHTELVESERVLNPQTSLALDANGRPHIAYAGDNLRYAWHDGASWHIETVDAPDLLVFYSSLALDSLDRPHILYWDGFDNPNLKYAWHDGTSWQIEVVESGLYMAMSSSLTLDSAGRPHVGYSNGVNNVRHAWRDATTWHVEHLETGAGSVDNVSLALDPLDRPHLSYRQINPIRSLKHAWHDGLTWRVETVDENDSLCHSLALDSTGRPHIGYASSNLKYALGSPTPFIAIDKRVTPGSLYPGDVLSYSLTLYGPDREARLWDPLPENLDYVSGSLSGTLSPPAVYSPAVRAIVWQGRLPSDTNPSLHLQATLNPAQPAALPGPLPIANTAWLTDLETGASVWSTATVTLLPPPFSLTKQATPDDDLQPGDLFSYSLTLSGPDLELRLWDPLPDQVTYVSGSLTSSLSPPPVYSPTARAFVWQGELDDDGPQAMDFQVQLTAPPSSPPIVNTAWLTNVESGLVTSATAAVQRAYASQTWHVEHVHRSKSFARITDRSLRLDAQGQPHVAYGENHLYHAWFDGETWQHEIVDGSPGVGRYASLALDTLGQPHVGYYDAVQSGLKYARYDGSAWHVEMVDSQRVVGKGTSLALDGSGHPHISYCDVENQTFKYAHYDGAAWQIEVVDDQFHGALFWSDTSLALDGSDRPRMIYLWGDELRYAWRDNDRWHVEPVDDDAGITASLALNASGQPRIIYRDQGAGTLTYAWRDDVGWHIQETSIEAGWVYGISLALDSLGWPHVSYDEESINQGLKYAWYDGAAWHTATADDNADGTNYNSLALDDSDRPRISYLCRGTELRYAWHDGNDWQSERIDQKEGITASSTSLAIDGLGHPHASYLSYDELLYAWHDGSTWQIEAVDEIPYQQGQPSLALDGSGNPHISYCDAGYQTLKYAHHDGAAWQIEVVDQHNGFHSSLALDDAGQPAIAYWRYGQPKDELVYAWHDGTDWHNEVVDGTGDSIENISLALDRTGRPHISYSHIIYDPDKRQLKHAWRDGSNWRVRTVDPTGGSHTSLRVDSVGHLHLSYVRSSYLRYARFDGRTWQFETIDRVGNGYGRFTSLALDSQGMPHIAYRDAINQDLKYARQDGANWHLEVVESQGDVGQHGSLALDALDRSHITYLDEYAVYYNDLKYARQTAFLTKRATPDDGLQADDLLTYTLTLAHPGADVRLWDRLPELVDYVPDSLTSSLSPPPVYSPTARAVVWAGQPLTDSLSLICLQVTPNVTNPETLSTPLPIANTAWLTDLDSGTILSSSASVDLMPIPLSLRERATPDAGVGYGDSLTFSLTLSGPGLNARLWDPLPRHVDYVSGSLTGTLTPPAVYSPTAHALLWQGRLPTETAPVVQFRITPAATGTGSLSLLLPTVNTAWLTNLDSGQTVSATVIVNGFRVYLPIIIPPRPWSFR